MLMFDTGWAGSFGKMCKALGEQNLKLSEIKYLLVSHFHPGHSDDSISLVLDSGDVFVGDLYPLYELEAYDEPVVQESWKQILSVNPKRIFYGHARNSRPH